MVLAIKIPVNRSLVGLNTPESLSIANNVFLISSLGEPLVNEEKQSYCNGFESYSWALAYWRPPARPFSSFTHITTLIVRLGLRFDTFKSRNCMVRVVRVRSTSIQYVATYRFPRNEGTSTIILCSLSHVPRVYMASHHNYLVWKLFTFGWQRRGSSTWLLNDTIRSVSNKLNLVDPQRCCKTGSHSMFELPCKDARRCGLDLGLECASTSSHLQSRSLRMVLSLHFSCCLCAVLLPYGVYIKAVM